MKYLWIIFLLLPFIACQSPQKTVSNDEAETLKTRKVEHEGYVELIDWLRARPGVQIRGSGNDYVVLIRGQKSIQGLNDPLYVVDGVPVGRKYNDARNAVDVNRIMNVVIVPPPRAGKYGNRGQNGIIEITTRRTL